MVQINIKSSGAGADRNPDENVGLLAKATLSPRQSAHVGTTYKCTIPFLGLGIFIGYPGAY